MIGSKTGKSSDRRRVAAVVLCLIYTFVTVGPSQTTHAGEETASLEIQANTSTINITRGDQPVLQYRHGEVAYKPYVAKFHSPSGINVLRDAPHDHIHHHALMFAVRADEVDFWIESPGQNPGKQLQKNIQSRTGSLSDDTKFASLSEQLQWVSATDQALLSERRTVAVYAHDDLDVSLMTWCSQLSPANGKDSVKLGGDHYFGLGMRFVQSMDQVGRFANSSGQPGDIVRGEERLVRAKWCAYTALAGGQTVTVAIFDHPDNPRHPATIFTMPRGFAYISATLNLWKEPLTIAADQTLMLRYGVALWDGEPSRPQIDNTYHRWVTLASEPAKLSGP